MYTWALEKSKIIDNSLLCKVWESQTPKLPNTYINKTLEEDPLLRYVEVILSKERLSIELIYDDKNNCTYTMPISNFYSIFGELLVEKRETKINKILEK